MRRLRASSFRQSPAGGSSRHRDQRTGRNQGRNRLPDTTRTPPPISETWPTGFATERWQPSLTCLWQEDPRSSLRPSSPELTNIFYLWSYERVTGVGFSDGEIPKENQPNVERVKEHSRSVIITK